MPDEGFSPTRPPAPTVREALPEDDDHPWCDLPSSDDRTMAVFCHVGGFFTSIVLPLILWLSNKDKSPFVANHGKEALNLQICQIVLGVVEMVAAFVVFVVRLAGGMSTSAVWGWLIAGAVVVALSILYELVLVPLASLAAWKGRSFRYPCIIRFVR